ncbi:helix-hairpin-helix domain-containing protein, partial [Candidatus Similichlamydia epinepheli]|uniref:helix-hairpin-helix domain-containing protein n=1 Tax=Candidatus Similichlamydia epinepheli TaxID=1903953 RepID=UPI0023D7DBE3
SIPGITSKKADHVHRAWKEQRDLCNLMIFCQKVGLSTNHSRKIYEKWGARSEEIIRDNPYLLIREIWGFGFKRADQIANNLELAPDSPIRIQASYEAVVTQGYQEGHTCFSRQQLIKGALNLLRIPSQSIVEIHLDHLLKEGRLVQFNKEGDLGEEPFIWSAQAYRTEENIAAQLDRLICSPSRVPSFDIESSGVIG